MHGKPPHTHSLTRHTTAATAAVTAATTATPPPHHPPLQHTISAPPLPHTISAHHRHCRFSSPWSLSGSFWAQGVAPDDDDDTDYYDPNSSFHPIQSKEFLPTLDKAVFQEGLTLVHSESVQKYRLPSILGNAVKMLVERTAKWCRELPMVGGWCCVLCVVCCGVLLLCWWVVGRGWRWWWWAAVVVVVAAAVVVVPGGPDGTAASGKSFGAIF